jgi:serine/threonine-protein kinase
MCEARDRHLGETASPSASNSRAETVVDSARTHGPDPGDRRNASEPEIETSPDVGETAAMLSPSIAQTLDMPSSVDSKMAKGALTTDPESRSMEVCADGETTHEGATAIGSASGERSRPVRLALSGYEIIAEIGRGGMGVVYKARHIRLDRLVALKMIVAGAHASHDQIARFHTEARAVAQMQHTGIVQIYEVGDHDGLPYFSLEFVPGGNLAQSIGGKPRPPRSAATMVMALCRAMAEAHARGIIHRDLKPANVLLTVDGSPKITDFGLAKQMEADSRQTHSRAVMGTPSYMAPEQAWGNTHDIGPLSDQYALGAILYEMLVGRPPFQGANPLETLELVRNQEPVPPRRLQPSVPTDLETICLKALQKDAARRFADTATMAEDLRRFLDGEPIVARAVSTSERFWRWCKRNPKVACLAAVIMLMGLAITAGSATFAASLKALNGKLAEAYKQEATARAIAQTNEQAAIEAKNKAIGATAAEAEARAKEKRAREKAESLLKGVFAHNRNALEAQRVLSVLLNQRLLAIPGTQSVRDELIKTTLTGLRATIASLEQLGTVAPGDDGFAMATRTLAGINQRAGEIAMEYGKYDETARYFRRMADLADELAAAEPGALDSQKVKASVDATLGDFQLSKIGDAEGAIKLFEQALALRRQWLAREPSSDDAKRGVANILGAIARARLQLGDPARARDMYREEIELREQFSQALADQLELRRERAGLCDKLGDLSVSLGDLEAGREHFQEALRLRREIAAQHPDETQAQRDALLSCEKIGTYELIHSRDPKAAREFYQEALDGFLERLTAEPTSVLAKADVALAQYFIATADLRLGNRESAMAHYRQCRDIREELAKDPRAKVNSLDLMLALARTGDHKRASEIAEDLIKGPHADARMCFYSACGFALSAGAAAALPSSSESTRMVRHYTGRALDALRLAQKHGWKSAVDIATDPDLDPIRTDPGFVDFLDSFGKAGP